MQQSITPKILTAEELANTNHDINKLNRELDIVKSKVFLGSNAAFLGSLMSSLYFQWSYDIPTAGTDGETFWWNPNDFIQLPLEEKTGTVEHELWHCARLHMLRRGLRDPQEWNYACDIRINRDLRKEGRHGALPIPMWIQNHPECPHELEEDIYDWLTTNRPPPPSGGSGGAAAAGQSTHMIDNPSVSKHKAINNVVKAVQQAKMAGAGNIPGDVESVLNTFLAPVVPWEAEFLRFFTDLLEDDFTWARPNRRYQDIYLPSRFTDEGRLAHLAYYFDVSGSVTDEQVTRFNSEVKFVKDRFNPLLMSLMQFDTKIQDRREITENDQFDQLKVHGRGGTCLRCVRADIEEIKPTAAIIFTDLDCAPMQRLSQDIPIIWVCIGNRTATVPFGKLIHIKE